MKGPSMAARIQDIVQQFEAEWQQRLEDSEQRIKELEREIAGLREQPRGPRSILDEITDAALSKRLEPFLNVKSLPLDTLIREAGVVLEDRLRTASQADSRLVGVELVDAALKPPEPMISFSSHPGEQEGVRMLYRGAIQFIRNPPMHRPIQYAESTVWLFLHLIDSLLLLLSQREPPQPEDSSMEDRYNYITNARSREMARKLVTEICGWHPEHVSAVPTKHDISLRVSGRVFAVLNPRLSFFNVYTYDKSGNWTRFRIDNEAHVKSVQPILRANVEALLSGDGLSQDDERTLEARYTYIADPEIRETAHSLVEELYGWDPERILVEPTSDYISIKVSGRLFAAVVPRMSYFNVYTYNATGDWTRHRVDNEGNVASVLPLVRASFEQCLGEHDSQMISEEGKPEETASSTEEEFWASLLKNAPHEYDSVRRLIDCYQQRDDIELDPMKMGLLVRLDIRDTGRQATIFLVQRSGSLGLWPATIASQLKGAGVDPSPVERYGAEMRRILKMPKQRKEFYRSIADVNLEAFKAAVDALIEEVQQAGRP